MKTVNCFILPSLDTTERWGGGIYMYLNKRGWGFLPEQSRSSPHNIYLYYIFMFYCSIFFFQYHRLGQPPHPHFLKSRNHRIPTIHKNISLYFLWLEREMGEAGVIEGCWYWAPMAETFFPGISGKKKTCTRSIHDIDIHILYRAVTSRELFDSVRCRFLCLDSIFLDSSYLWYITFHEYLIYSLHLYNHLKMSSKSQIIQ